MIRRKSRTAGQGEAGRTANAAQVAAALVARRPFTEAELRRALEERGHPPDDIDGAVSRLSRDGYLDDRSLALDYILVRSERLSHGPVRLLRELTARGVEESVAAWAWHEAVERYALEPGEILERQLRRQLRRHGKRLDPRGYRRVYNALLRAGFDPSSVREVLEPCRAFTDAVDEFGVDGDDDDLA